MTARQVKQAEQARQCEQVEQAKQARQTTPDQYNHAAYHGHILDGHYSDFLKQHIIQCINTLTLIENTGNPAMLYIAAWKENENNIWYEYMCKKISFILGCRSSETADTFCRSVMERRIYKHGDKDEDTDIQTKKIDQNALNYERNSLRSNNVSAGITEAVYKIRLHGGRCIWLNDKASIERYQEDGICISFGSLTDVTKEMKSEDEREKLVLQLQETLKKVKILNGLLPICASCKQIRDDQGYWNQIEDYISKHSEAQFSHGVCPDCAKKLYPDFF